MTEEQIQKLYDAITALLMDITAMQNKDMTDYFGEFSEYQHHNDGNITIEWPNLAIGIERIREILQEIDQDALLA